MVHRACDFPGHPTYHGYERDSSPVLREHALGSDIEPGTTMGSRQRHHRSEPPGNRGTRPPPVPDLTSHGPGNDLPRLLTSFVGRTVELETVRTLLLRDDVRLVTLTGPGGSGKTRLAIEVARHAPPGAWEDIWFAPLAAVRDPDLVIPAIARAVGVRQASGRSAIDRVTRFLRPRRALLLIDNFEPVIAAAPSLASILTACPMVTMLVTSRTVLRLSGEHVVRVPPLALPDPGDRPQVSVLRETDAIKLFMDRAQASHPGVRLTEENAATIVAICRRLEGLPLALELAAARVAFLSPTSLLRLLDARLDVLASGPRDAPDRHRSMRDTIAWSYELLPDHEKAALRRLAVFVGGFDADAGEEVVDQPDPFFDTLASLVSQSLITPLPSATTESRFILLETLREYGLERLEAAGETESTRERHAAWFMAEAERSEYAWLMPLDEGAILLSRLEMNHANMREALDWLYQTGDDDSALHMAGLLAPLWVVCGHASEGRAWLERLLPLQSKPGGRIHAIALGALSWLCNQQGAPQQAFETAEEALSIAGSLDEPFLTVRYLVLSGVAASDLGQLDLSKARFEAAMERTLTLDGPDWWNNWIIIQMTHLGYNALIQGDIDEAEARFRDAINRQVARGFAPGTSHLYGYMVLAGLGRAARARGDFAGALHLFQQSLDFTQRSPPLAVSLVNHSIRVIALIAGVLARLGHMERATRLFGACNALQERYSYHFPEAADLLQAFGLPPHRPPHVPVSAIRHVPHDRPERYEGIDATHRPPPDALIRAWEEGSALTLDAAIAEALSASAAPRFAGEDRLQHMLTTRQIEVLQLVAEGRSNREIAETLSLSERTVEHHVTHILDRLGLESRTAAATYAIRKDLL